MWPREVQGAGRVSRGRSDRGGEDGRVADRVGEKPPSSGFSPLINQPPTETWTLRIDPLQVGSQIQERMKKEASS